jgi:hypothetical protein
MPARRLAICHPVKSTALIAAPPVENSTDAMTRANAARRWLFGIGQG